MEISRWCKNYTIVGVKITPSLAIVGVKITPYK